MEISKKEVEKIKTAEVLILKMHEYVDLLVAEINELLPYATSHGWETKRAVSGNRLWKEIEQLKNKINEK